MHPGNDLSTWLPLAISLALVFWLTLGQAKSKSPADSPDNSPESEE